MQGGPEVEREQGAEGQGVSMGAGQGVEQGAWQGARQEHGRETGQDKGLRAIRKLLYILSLVFSQWS